MRLSWITLNARFEARGLSSVLVRAIVNIPNSQVRIQPSLPRRLRGRVCIGLKGHPAFSFALSVRERSMQQVLPLGRVPYLSY